jgi:cytochrome c553
MKQLKYIILITVAVVLLYACAPAGGNRTGHEYMPDMAHPITYESNVLDDYWYNTWEQESSVGRKTLSNPRLPVRGTVPRGYAGYVGKDPLEFERTYNSLRGGDNLNAIAIPLNGHVPYHYSDTEEERTRASREIISNPFPITVNGLARGKALYDVNCGICHGETGNGLGYLVSDENRNVKYPAAPANFLQDTFYNSTNGRMYHAIMFGKNVMGAYADKLNFEERWQVIHYIRALQAKELKKEYTAEANTFNPSFGMPDKQFKLLAGNRSDTPAPPQPAVPRQDSLENQERQGDAPGTPTQQNTRSKTTGSSTSDHGSGH